MNKNKALGWTNKLKERWEAGLKQAIINRDVECTIYPNLRGKAKKACDAKIQHFNKLINELQEAIAAMDYIEKNLK